MRIICPACGVNMMLPVDEPGELIECAGCGKRLRLNQVPQTLGSQPLDSLTVSPGERTQPRRSFKSRTLLLAAIAGAALSGMVAILISIVRPPSAAPITAAPAITAEAIPWDRAHRADLLAMKTNADALVRHGQWQQSYDAYQQILMTIGDHPISDPVAAAIVESVRSGQDRAMTAMLSVQTFASDSKTHNLTTATQPVSAPVPLTPVGHSVSTTTPSPPVTRPTATQPTTASALTLTPEEIAADTAAPLAGATTAPLSPHAYTLPDTVTDEQIGDALGKGVQFLESQFVNGEIKTGLGDGSGPMNRRRNRGNGGGPSNLDNPSDLGNVPSPTPQLPSPPNFVAPWESAFSTPGIDALCVYALLNAGRATNVPGLAVNDPFTVQVLEQLKQYDMQFTYHRSLRAAALAVFNRSEDNAALEEDLRWLLAASMEGGYTYTLPPTGGQGLLPDNSNSQYGLLGVWSGAQAGKAVALQYWVDVERHWNNCALQNGRWGYTVGAAPTTTMTCAGIASLEVARDYLDASNISGAGDRPSPSPTLDAGLSWLDTADNCKSDLAGDGMGGAGYGLYGLERVGLASGYKYFGNHDWYAEFARQLVAEQHMDGSWGGKENAGKVQAQSLIDTAYALLFLARGRHPILFNKLRYEGPWNNRPHDVAHLARFAANQLERPLNWQVVNLRRNWFDWMDCPVLYITGDRRVKLLPQDYLALREFVNGGGTIFTHADDGSTDFNRWVADLVRQIFPKYELMLIPREHAIYSAVYRIKNPPPLLAVSNGSRLLLIHSPTDLAGGWQSNWTDEKKVAFQMGINLFVYAAGKGNLKNRLSSSYIPADPDRPDGSRQIARLQYPGEWDPEPYAWTRFTRYFQWETHQGIEPVIVPMKDLTPLSEPLAALTGTVRHDFTPAECAAAREYVKAGGVLMIDSCGGQSDFIKSVETTLLPRAFPGLSPAPIPADHPLLLASRVGADDLAHPVLCAYASENNGKNLPLESIAFGRGWIIFSRLDLTTGLLGTESWGIQGFAPSYCAALMKNAVLWAEARSTPPMPTN